MIRIVIVYAVIVIAAILHASSAHATEAAYRDAVAASRSRRLLRSPRAGQGHASRLRAQHTSLGGRELFELVSRKCD